MQSTVFTNSNEIFAILHECVNVQHLDRANRDRVEDIFIYDEQLLPEGHGDEIRFTLRELKTLRPQWDEWLLASLQDNKGVHDRYLYDGRHYYNVFYDVECQDVLFHKAYFWPEHFRPGDLLYTSLSLSIASRGQIRRFLKVPLMTQSLQEELYYRVDLGCPLSHYELQQSLSQAFKKLLQQSEDSMEN